MPSNIHNLHRKVEWSDFRGPVPPGATMDAEIFTKFEFTYSWTSDASGRATLDDNVQMTIILNQSKSWAKPGAARTAELLQHEQRHYDITALLARDLFIELMQMKKQTFASVAELTDRIKQLETQHYPQPLHDRYDVETGHSQNRAQQHLWDCLITRAKEVGRTPRVTALDGAPYKLRLLDVLGQVTPACPPQNP